MPIKFDDLGTVGTIAKKLQKKLGGRDDTYEQGSFSAYDQRLQSHGYSQQGSYAQPQYYQAPHHQPQQQPHYQHSPYPHQPPQHHPQYPHGLQPHAYQHPSPRPMASSPRPTDQGRYRDSRPPQPYPGSYGSPSPRPASFQQSSGHNRLPPGAHIDTKTGRVQTNMFPPGYDGPLLQR